PGRAGRVWQAHPVAERRRIRPRPLWIRGFRPWRRRASPPRIVPPVNWFRARSRRARRAWRSVAARSPSRQDLDLDHAADDAGAKRLEEQSRVSEALAAAEVVHLLV